MSAQAQSNVAQLPPPSTELDVLAWELRKAKDAEKAATEHRVRCEEAIETFLGTQVPEEGTCNAEGNYYKVKVTTKFTRTIDKTKVGDVINALPEAISHRLFAWEPKLDMKELRYVQHNEPDYYAIVAEAITTKRAKTAVVADSIKQEG